MSESSIINKITEEYINNQASVYTTIYGVPLNSLTKIELEALLVKFHKDWRDNVWQGVTQ